MFEWIWQAGSVLLIFLLGYIMFLMGVVGIFIGLNWRPSSIVGEILTNNQSLWTGVPVVFFVTPVIPSIFFTWSYWPYDLAL